MQEDIFRGTTFNYILQGYIRVLQFVQKLQVSEKTTSLISLRTSVLSIVTILGAQILTTAVFI